MLALQYTRSRELFVLITRLLPGTASSSLCAAVFRSCVDSDTALFSDFSIPFHQGSDDWKHLVVAQFLPPTTWILLIRLSYSPRPYWFIFHRYQASPRKQHWCYMDSLYYNWVANKNAKVPWNNAIWGDVKEIPSRSVKEFIYYGVGDSKAVVLLSHLKEYPLLLQRAHIHHVGWQRF